MSSANPYAAEHANPQGAGDSRPTVERIIEDEGVKGQWNDKTVVITGAGSGIGIETARALASTGASLILPVRNLNAAKEALGDLANSDKVTFVDMDLNSLDSIRTAAKDILSKSSGKINILIQNAGVMFVPERTLTVDGYETQFQINHLAPFLFFQLLKDALLASATPDFPSRVVIVSSGMARGGKLPPGADYNFEKTAYNPLFAYQNSKLAAVLDANGIERRFGQQHLHATSLHPGVILTRLGRHMSDDAIDSMVVQYRNMIKSPSQGAATIVWAAVGKEWKHRGGRYLEDCREAEEGSDNDNGFDPGFAPRMYDVEAEGRLWADSLKMLGMA